MSISLTLKDAVVTSWSHLWPDQKQAVAVALGYPPQESDSHPRVFASNVLDWAEREGQLVPLLTRIRAETA